MIKALLNLIFQNGDLTEFGLFVAGVLVIGAMLLELAR